MACYTRLPYCTKSNQWNRGLHLHTTAKHNPVLNLKSRSVWWKTLKDEIKENFQNNTLIEQALKATLHCSPVRLNKDGSHCCLHNISEMYSETAVHLLVSATFSLAYPFLKSSMQLACCLQPHLSLCHSHHGHPLLQDYWLSRAKLLQRLFLTQPFQALSSATFWPVTNSAKYLTVIQPSWSSREDN